MLSVIWRGWRFVGRRIAAAQSFLVLTLVYFVVIGPVALAVRWFSDPLGLRGDPTWRLLSRGESALPSLRSVRQQF